MGLSFLPPIMEEYCAKYSEIMGISKQDVMNIILSIVDDENFTEKLLEVLGEENISDVIEISKRMRTVSSEFVDVDVATYIRRTFPTVSSVKHDGITCVKVDEVQNGKKYFGFEYFNEVQSVVFESIYKGNKNVLVAAPTGSGKTNIAVLSILKLINTGRNYKVVYVAPMKALATEVTRKLCKIFPENKICEFTGDTELTSREVRSYNIFVCTPEKFEVVTRRQDNIFRSLDLLILDEVHMLQDERGSVIESIVCRIFRLIELWQSSIRIIALSATLPNPKDIAEFIKAPDVFSFDDSFRPVELNTSILGVFGSKSGGKKRAKEATPQDLMDACNDTISRIGDKQILVFVHSRQDTVRTAQSIYNNIPEGPLPSTRDRFEDPVFNELLRKRIGVHHAGMTRSSRLKSEKLFLSGDIRILVCTSTLAWGVNLPANTVIIKGTSYYDGNLGKFRTISILDIVQIFGRAGRPDFEKAGNAVLIASFGELKHFTKLLLNKDDIESTLLTSLVDFLNAEISLMNIQSVEDIVSWLKDTYLCVRIRRNPLKYGMKRGENIFCVMAEYATLAVRRLLEYDLIRYDTFTVSSDRRTFRSTQYGRISSNLFLRHDTINGWIKGIPDVRDMRTLLEVILKSPDFSTISLKDEELEALNDLSSSLGLEFEGTPLCKATVLALSWFNGARTDVPSLQCDQRYILYNLKRVTKAFLDVIIEIRAFELFEYALGIMHSLAGHQPHHKLVVKYPSSIKIYKIGPYRRMTCDVPGERSNMYILLKLGSKVLEAFTFMNSIDVYFKCDADFDIFIGSLEYRHRARLGSCSQFVMGCSPIECLYFYGVHTCGSGGSWKISSAEEFTCAHFSINKAEGAPGRDGKSKGYADVISMIKQGESLKYPVRINLNAHLNFKFVEVSDPSSTEASLCAFNIIRDITCKVVVVVKSEHELRRTIHVLRVQYSIHGLTPRNGSAYGVGREGSFPVSVSLIDKVSVRPGDFVVFKGCRAHPLYKVFDVCRGCTVVILESSDYMGHLRYILGITGS